MSFWYGIEILNKFGTVFLILLHTPSFLMEIVLVSDQFANSRPSASNFKSFSRSLEQFFLTVGQNNFGNKIPFPCHFRENQTKWDLIHLSLSNQSTSNVLYVLSPCLNDIARPSFHKLRPKSIHTSKSRR